MGEKTHDTLVDDTLRLQLLQLLVREINSILELVVPEERVRLREERRRQEGADPVCAEDEEVRARV